GRAPSPPPATPARRPGPRGRRGNAGGGGRRGPRSRGGRRRPAARPDACVRAPPGGMRPARRDRGGRGWWSRPKRNARPRAGRERGRAWTSPRRPRGAGTPRSAARPSRRDPPEHAFELLAVAGPRIGLRDPGARLGAEPGAERRLAGQPLENAGEVGVVALAEMEPLLLLAHDLVERRP